MDDTCVLGAMLVNPLPSCLVDNGIPGLEEQIVHLFYMIDVLENKHAVRSENPLDFCTAWGVISVSKEGVSISEAGCEGCGACAAACPSGALQIPVSTDAQIISQIDTALKEKKEYPLIIAFLCNYCAYEAADTAGLNKVRYPTNVRPIWVMCSGRVNPQFVLEALEKGADGVLIMGCYPQDCHYRTGFLKTQRRVEVLKEMLKSIGINPKRLRLESASASEGKKFANVIKEFTEELRSLPTIGSELLEKTM